jgi:hypothetical protein
MSGRTSRTGWFTSVSGSSISVSQPEPETILIDDIARSLSMQCRYVGHVSRFYSVAEHSFLVSLNCGDDPFDQMWGLLHDAPEMILGDLSAPIKNMPELSVYRLLESRIMAAVCTRFGLSLREPQIVRDTDIAIRTVERAKLRNEAPPSGAFCLPVIIEGWPPVEAEMMFLKQFHALAEACRDLSFQSQEKARNV